MATETMEKIAAISPHWKIGKIRDMHVSVEIGGHTKMEIPLMQFMDGALRQLRAIYLSRIHNLVIERAGI